jgi:anaphase-promoting complex subunit 3
MGISSVLHALIDHSLSLFLYENATFYAERLFYESPSAEALNILAQCYFRQGKTKQAYLILQETISSSSNRNKYLLALICVTLGKLDEAEKVLLPRNISNVVLEALSQVPGGAAGVYLLGKICRQQHRRDTAEAYYKVCLQVSSHRSVFLELSSIAMHSPIFC